MRRASVVLVVSVALWFGATFHASGPHHVPILVS